MGGKGLEIAPAITQPVSKDTTVGRGSPLPCVHVTSAWGPPDHSVTPHTTGLMYVWHDRTEGLGYHSTAGVLVWGVRSSACCVSYAHSYPSLCLPLTLLPLASDLTASSTFLPPACLNCPTFGRVVLLICITVCTSLSTLCSSKFAAKHGTRLMDCGSMYQTTFGLMKPPLAGGGYR